MSDLSFEDEETNIEIAHEHESEKELEWDDSLELNIGTKLKYKKGDNSPIYDIIGILRTRMVLIEPLCVSDLKETLISDCMEEAVSSRFGHDDRTKETFSGKLQLLYKSIEQANKVVVKLTNFKENVSVKRLSRSNAGPFRIGHVRSNRNNILYNNMIRLVSIPENVKEKDIFSYFPSSLDIWIPLSDEETQKDYAYVEFSSPEEAQKIVSTRRTIDIYGKPVCIELVQDPTSNRNKYSSKKKWRTKTLSNSHDDDLSKLFELRQELKSKVTNCSLQLRDINSNKIQVSNEEQVELKKEFKVLSSQISNLNKKFEQLNITHRTNDGLQRVPNFYQKSNRFFKYSGVSTNHTRQGEQSYGCYKSRHFPVHAYQNNKQRNLFNNCSSNINYRTSSVPSLMNCSNSVSHNLTHKSETYRSESRRSYGNFCS